MDFYGAFKNFFGIPNSVPPKEFTFEDYTDNCEPGALQPPDINHGNTIWNEFIRNPMDFHKMIEQQMQHMMRAFGMGSEVSDFFSNHPDSAIQLDPSKNSSLRDQFLKPGFDHPSTSKTDTDLDGQVNNMDEIDTVLKPKEGNMPVTSYHRPNIQTRYYGQSMSTRTVIKPDGSIETTQTRRDNDGNQETIVTRKQKDSEYTIISRVNKHGEESKEEKFVNHSENPDIVMLPSKSESWIDYFFKH